MEAFEFFGRCRNDGKTSGMCKKTGWFPCHADFRPYTAKNGNCGQSG